MILGKREERGNGSAWKHFSSDGESGSFDRFPWK